MKKVLLFFILLLSFTSFSQSINDYQYVIVPIKFGFLKENDKYRLNTTTKMLLQKYGFKSYLSTDDMPNEAANNKCKVLYATVEKKNDVLMTKIKVVLKDCKEKIVFETAYGTSRLKDLAPAYNEAIREAFKSFEKLKYKYSEQNEVVVEAIAPAQPESIKLEENVPNQAPETSETPEVFFFAQPTANGYQVVDNEPKVIMRLYNTSQKNVFIADKKGINGTVLIKEGQWVFEYYDNGKLVSEPINLKF
ncbi:hypothetical protein [Flavobacterium terrisoli]|uniref:hypothetical protein n=1 Tax=Flavobacterium terrisoli TaxID=3242195 RepID=UPI00254381D6|nr:hypothetical protein [Flavobacterium buctense]